MRFCVIRLTVVDTRGIAYNMKEHEKAKAWRQKRKLSQAQLAELTGYGVRSIFWMELGLSPPNGQSKARPVPPWIWRRYKMMCHGVDALIRSGKEFDW